MFAMWHSSRPLWRGTGLLSPEPPKFSFQNQSALQLSRLFSKKKTPAGRIFGIANVVGAGIVPLPFWRSSWGKPVP